MKVLLADDDTDLTDVLCEYLEQQGLNVYPVSDGETALTKFYEEPWDMVVLDIMMPGLNGLDLLTRIRARSEVPVVMLTAKGDEDDKVRGFSLGADDYVAKPFSAKELTARLQAHCRRRTAYKRDSLKRNNIELLHDEFTVRVNGEHVVLTSAERSILRLLLTSGHEPTTRDRIYRVVFGRELSPFDRSLDTHISNLRRKLTQTGCAHPKIKAIRGVGYVLVD